MDSSAIITVGDAAAILGTSHATAKRRIRSSGLGVHLSDDRLIGVRRGDVERVGRIAAGIEPVVQRDASANLISVTEAARILKGSRQAVKRAIAESGLGIPVSGKRLSAVKYGDLAMVSELMRRQVGNPVWISRRGVGPYAGRRKKKKPPMYIEK